MVARCPFILPGCRRLTSFGRSQPTREPARQPLAPLAPSPDPANRNLVQFAARNLIVVILAASRFKSQAIVQPFAVHQSGRSISTMTLRAPASPMKL